MTTIAGRRLWWLTVYDPGTGIATRVVGVVGAEGTLRHLSWMPVDEAVTQWATAFDTSGVFVGIMAVDVDAAVTVADGIVLGFVEVEDLPSSGDLAGAVEAAVDRALSAAIEDTRGA